MKSSCPCTMTLFAAFAAALISSVSPAARATVLSYTASGTVTTITGNPALFPLAVTLGDSFVLGFSFEDTLPPASNGVYPTIDVTLTIEANSFSFSGPNGEGRIHIQNDPATNLWGVSGCVEHCGNLVGIDARFNLFFPSGTIPSRDLTPMPDSSGATVQFGLFYIDNGVALARAIATLETVDAISTVPVLPTPLLVIVAWGLLFLPRVRARSD